MGKIRCPECSGKMYTVSMRKEHTSESLGMRFCNVCKELYKLRLVKVREESLSNKRI